MATAPAPATPIGPVIRNAHILAPGADPALKASWTPLTGEQFLHYGPDGKGMDVGRANMIRSIANGDTAYPTGFFLKTPQGQQLARDTMMFDPTFTAINLDARKAARTKFTSGKFAEQMIYGDQAIRHATDLYEAIGHLGNAKGTHNLGEAVVATLNPLGDKAVLPELNNAAAHVIANVTGTNERFKNYEPFRQGLILETAKFHKGGVPDVHDVKQYEGILNPDDPPEAQRAAVLSMIKMIDSGLKTRAEAYSRAMGRTQDPYEGLSPDSRKALETMLRGGVAAAPHQPTQPVAPKVAFPVPSAGGAAPRERHYNPQTGRLE